MANAVFTHADGSIYDDLPEARYHFPQTYLRAVESAVGDWIVYYEPRRITAASEKTGGRQAYFAAARVVSVERDFSREGHFFAFVSDYIAFPNAVPFHEGGDYFETLLQRPDGKTNKGAFGRSVRQVPAPEFNRILLAGFSGVREEMGPDDWAEGYDQDGFQEPATPFERPILERLSRRPFREAAFARQVKAAYGQRCAMTGLKILNGGGRPEVQAAHIRPVKAGGPDTIRNGIALCGTAHWMFDRGLVSVGDDHRILVAEDRVPDAAKSLLRPDRQLLLPDATFLQPHPDYLAHHRAGFKG